jgi:transcriptional regulator with XRE-family HTH domain
MKIGERIKYFRESNGLKLREVAAGTGLSISFISDMERGRTMPSLATCQKLATLFRMPLIILFSGVKIETEQNS